MLRRLALPLVLLVSAGAALAQNDVIGLFLSWQRDPTTTITVNWVNLYEHTPARVWYRPAGTQEWRTQSGTRGTLKPSVLRVGRVELAEPRRHLFHVTLHPEGKARIQAVDAEGQVFDEVFLTSPRTRPVTP
jgi:hypothetical protein